MTFQDALEAKLKQLDSTYMEWRKNVGDLKILNRSCPEVQTSRANLVQAAEDIFTLKCIWQESKDTMEKYPSSTIFVIKS